MMNNAYAHTHIDLWPARLADYAEGVGLDLQQQIFN